jgi:DNA-directed RNA polymerase subunit RPC12/RpoP
MRSDGETMKWHCCDCKANFQGPKDRPPANGCAQCGSKNIFDCNVEYVGEVIPYPIVTSHRKCDQCGKEMRHHGYIEALEMAVCP